jgi:hypothetical protein
LARISEDKIGTEGEDEIGEEGEKSKSVKVAVHSINGESVEGLKERMIVHC